MSFDAFLDLVFAGLGGLLGLFLAGLVLVGFAAMVDTVYDRRAFVAQIACEAQRLEPRRRFLSSEVLCIPSNRRQDTTTVQVR